MKRRDLVKSADARATEMNKAAAMLATLLLALFGAGCTTAAQAQSIASGATGEFYFWTN